MYRLGFLHRITLLSKETEFFIVLAWFLLFPAKTSYFYFLTCAALVTFFLIKELNLIKNAGFSPVSVGLFVVNLVLLASIFFSGYPIRSILLVSDVLLVSLYFLVSYLDREDEDRFFFLVLTVISLFSLVYILNAVFLVFRERNIFYENPIFQGIGSGVGVIVAVFYLLKKFKVHLLVFLIVNTAAVYMSGSKAAFLGMAGSVVFLAVLKKRLWIPVIGALLILTFLVPNPVKHVFYTSLKHDPYVFDRIDIWKLSWNVFQDNWPTGVGLDNFQDISKKYNFKQTREPANYFKIPRTPHNDYLKIMAETGLAGAVLVLAFLIAVLVRIFSSPLFNLNKILILYLLFQAFLFNILFQFFFFFLLVFLLKNLFGENLLFRTLPDYAKMLFSGFAILILIFGYLFPFFSDHYLNRARKSKNMKTAMDWLNKSQFFNPFDQNIYYSKSLFFFGDFQRTADLESFYQGVENVRKVQKMNRNFLPAYTLECDFYLEIYKKGLNYPALAAEIMAPLENAGHVAPFNPFLRLMKAQIYLEFGKRSKAKTEALASLEIEPGYVSARYFLRDHFDYYPDPIRFENEINSILQIARRYSPAKGSYLDELFRVPVRPNANPPFR